MSSNFIASASHPCFGMTARKTVGRLHLPVAPRANTRSRFSDTANSRPAMMPEDAVTWLDHVIRQGKPVSMVGITGPGDPLADPEPSLRTLRMVRERYPEISLCLTTVGLNGARYAVELAEIGLSHITVLVDAVDPEVAEKLYAWIRPSTRTMPLKEAARLLVSEQAAAITAFKKAGLTVKINTTVYAGYNAGHVEAVAASMANLGADIMAVVPYRLTRESEENPVESGIEMLATVRDRAARHMDLMPAWNECGEHLVGLETPSKPDASVSILPKPTAERPNVAVVSSTGMDVDLHLGHAIKILVYGPREDGLPCLLESRDAPEPGSGGKRWETLASGLSDCFVLLTAAAGDNPRQILSRNGLSVLITDGEIAGTVDVLYGGGKKAKKCKK
ncbi:MULTISPECIES: radical SAM protein [unclassified Pseudodesulfovibrio]|uniref:NifB/NifX family molybdenum-iron cluster-binding protein n=1 Tax=unclassified Pseudodesulfovibrio TaxID=2661612 RepID=UPI000FEC0122|nr:MULTISPECIES: radical SAM protein [unclassified Pseudodesulfovibrio]MCJ2163479.1 radical SAM protein [Pseudodesulfovibrio sp. S3-i]RWU06715.1 radical SAM protein [Pseudodesulfovibrio sp. S3]